MSVTIASYCQVNTDICVFHYTKIVKFHFWDSSGDLMAILSRSSDHIRVPLLTYSLWLPASWKENIFKVTYLWIVHSEIHSEVLSRVLRLIRPVTQFPLHVRDQNYNIPPRQGVSLLQGYSFTGGWLGTMWREMFYSRTHWPIQSEIWNHNLAILSARA